MISLYKEALTSDPLATSVLVNLGGALYNVNRPEEMAPLVERLRQINPQSIPTKWLAGLHQLGSGNAEAALDYFRSIDNLVGDWGAATAAYDLGLDAESDESMQRLIENGDSPVVLAILYAHRENFEMAFETLEHAYDVHNDEMVEIRMYPHFRPMHDDPRWAVLLEKIGISDTDARRIGL
jgi:tetratricopeptide (TPR) repeat protein